MRYIKYLFLLVTGVVLVTVALANRQSVTLHLVPDELRGIVPVANDFEMPLFLVILGSIVIGLLIGFVWEYFREYRLRAEASRRKRDLNRLEREVKGLRDKSGDGKDDVLALLD